jgi:hypothetical protein
VWWNTHGGGSAGVIEAVVWARSRPLHGSPFEVGVSIVVRGVGGRRPSGRWNTGCVLLAV